MIRSLKVLAVLALAGLSITTVGCGGKANAINPRHS